VAALALFSSTAFASTITYTFTMNTSSLSGTDGFIDMQFSEGSSASGTTLAVVSDFQTDGTLVVEDPYTTLFPGGVSLLATGNVSGTLAQPVTFTADGSAPINEYTQELTFGNQLSFLVTLSGQGLTSPTCLAGPPYCYQFVLDFLNSTGTGFLFTNDPTGSTPTGWIAGGVNVNNNASTTLFINPGPSNGPSDLTITSSVPEPATWWMLAGGLLGMIGLRRRRR